MAGDLPPKRWRATVEIELTLPFTAGHYHVRKAIADALLAADPDDEQKPSLQLTDAEILYELGEKPDPSTFLGLVPRVGEDLIPTPEILLRLSAVAKEHGQVLAYTVKPGTAPDGGPIVDLPLSLTVEAQEVFGVHAAAFIFRLAGGEGKDELCKFLVRSADLTWLVKAAAAGGS
ncbi:MAG TPA: hypothetical protein VFU11_11110 [Solirubrobacterales bacterium]|nr:hypothetical protein [Solirubrobacterales bacterium]